VPSADANPYLVLAAILSGVYTGIENKSDPGDAFEGLDCNEHLFPKTLTEALLELDADNALRETLGSHFVDIYLAYKRSEIKAFNHFIAAREYAWYS
jgi:glutamine synthetase